MIAGLTANLRAFLSQKNVEEASIREADKAALTLAACEPQAADEVALKLEAAIEFSGMDLSEDTCDVLTRTAIRHAIRFIEQGGERRSHVA